MSNMSLHLVVLAAWMWSRYWGLKQLDTFWSWHHALMEYSVYDAKRAWFDKVIFVIRKSFEEEFKEKIGKKIEQFITVDYAFQDMNGLPSGFVCPETREKPWGTWHAVLSAKDYIDWPFAVINADDFYGRESYEVIANFLKSNDKNAIVWYKISEVLSDYWTVSRGMCELNPQWELIAIHETKKIYKKDWSIFADREDWTSFEINANELCSMNMMWFKLDSLWYYERYFKEFLEKNINDPKIEFYMPEVITRLINEEWEHVPVLPTSAQWFWVTYQEDKENTNKSIDKLIEEWLYPMNLRE
jgi:hypothetical protein